MFQIGDKVYLILEEGIVSADYSNIGKLKEINENNYFSYRGDNDIYFSPSLSNNASSLKDGAYNCGTWQEQRVTNNRERTYLRISIHTTDVGNGTNQYVNYMVRPYKKTLGIWYWCTRHISCNIKVAADYKVYTSSSSWTWTRVNGSYSCTNKYASSVSGQLCSQCDYSGDSAPPFRCKRRHLNWADLFYNINQFFSVFFFRKESPFNSNLCALPDNLSIIASATVFSPIYSYHLLTGICEDINVDRLP